jgi:serine/threonine protein kinase
MSERETNTDPEYFTDTAYTDDEDFLDGGPPGLERGEKLASGYTAIAHLHRSNKYDVYDAWSHERECRVIAKTPIPMDDEEDPEKEKTFFERSTKSLFREARLLKKLTHPHIVRAYGTVEEPRPILVLETITGETLSHLIDRSYNRLPLPALTHLGLHLCSAIHYLHHHGILHLDLKPSNIVSERGMAKILDLSIARKPGRGKRGSGTLHYLAPEQASGATLTPATDVWGIGATLFEAATDELPFHADEAEGSSEGTPASEPSDERTYERVEDYEQLRRRADPVKKHRRVPAEFASIIDDCLEPEPEKRPTVAELSARLRKFGGIKAF